MTGAASGIGLGIARAFQAKGSRLVLLDRERDRVQAVAAGDGSAVALECDVAKPVEVAAAFAEVQRRMGRVDSLICAAGVREVGDALTLPVEAWDTTIAVDLSGVFYCCQAAARIMARHDGGSLVAISSVNGIVGEPQRPAYCAAKHGVLGLIKTLARDLAKHGIRANAVCPGLIRTPLTDPYFEDDSFAEELAISVPLGGPGKPRHIGDAAVFLCSPEAEYITGTSLTVDGGFLADKMFAPPRAGSAYA